jgi:hypothetical protein
MACSCVVVLSSFAIVSSIFRCKASDSFGDSPDPGFLDMVFGGLNAIFEYQIF